ncbi:DNA-binding protein [Boletus reticuloceps]|uniref:DNA-binding protein n=1 Tax=Boletus reticuloceps TaxID=495285 RepID=A0A8I2Z1A9_9AGAM|nr:DNA-binding protein [Boletus reticuloceps]
MAEISLTYNLKGMAEFIEVAIHTILYARQIYPPDLFVRRKRYDMPVFQSRHPALNEYISGAVKAIADELASGNIQKVVIVIKDKDQVPLERFIFAVQNMIEVEAYNRDVSVQEAMTSAALSRYFRAFLVKLSMVESQLGSLEPQGSLAQSIQASCTNYVTDDASFAILLELRDDKEPPIGPQDDMSQDPPPWVPADKQYTTLGTPDDAQLHLLRVVETGIVNLSLAVQESKEKLERLKKPPNKSNSDQNGKESEKPT